MSSSPTVTEKHLVEGADAYKICRGSKSSRWYGVLVWRVRCQPRCLPHHLIVLRYHEVSFDKPQEAFATSPHLCLIPSLRAVHFRKKLQIVAFFLHFVFELLRMRGVLLLGWIACWTVVCHCHDGRMDSEATTDMDEYLSDLLKEDFVFLSGKGKPAKFLFKGGEPVYVMVNHKCICYNSR
ncbi:hypothetical protein TNCV_4230181 [Trichonephila clavipes]|uniref:Uncharacterized protein n=1 Tax=Trichonephila clavipes TaxID=2585209 RepID=A0A8X6SDG5_TRICX|nr:hypothetical protein TNCV_4230181 [Trichonephila clavipes]